MPVLLPGLCSGCFSKALSILQWHLQARNKVCLKHSTMIPPNIKEGWSMLCRDFPPTHNPLNFYFLGFFYVWFVFKGLKKVCTTVSFWNRFLSCWLSFLQTVLRQGGDRKDEEMLWRMLSSEPAEFQQNHMYPPSRPSTQRSVTR